MKKLFFFFKFTFKVGDRVVAEQKLEIWKKIVPKGTIMTIVKITKEEWILKNDNWEEDRIMRSWKKKYLSKYKVLFIST